MARNCHKSVYHAVYMNELHPIYLYPKFYGDMELCGEIMLEDVEKALEDYPNIQAVVITSPTYEGILSDVESIAKIVHRKSIPLKYFNKKGYLLKEKYRPRLDYLSVVNDFLEVKENGKN